MGSDLEKKQWKGYKVCAIAGCTDEQCSGDIGVGGIMTHSMLLAVQKLQASGEKAYTCATLYNMMLDFDDKKFRSKQDISISSSGGFMPNQMAWPLIPTGDYMAPLNRKAPTTTSQAPPGET